MVNKNESNANWSVNQKEKNDQIIYANTESYRRNKRGSRKKESIDMATTSNSVFMLPLKAGLFIIILVCISERCSLPHCWGGYL